MLREGQPGDSISSHVDRLQTEAARLSSVGTSAAVSSKPRRLVLLTAHFPFGFEETFLESELPILCRGFEEVDVVPFNEISHPDASIARTLPRNARLRDDFVRTLVRQRKRRLRRMLSLLCRPHILYLLLREVTAFLRHLQASEITGDLRAWWSAACRMLSFLSLSTLLQRLLVGHYRARFCDTVFYSYWLREPALALAMMRSSYPDVRCVARCHGGDLYAELRRPAYIPFQAATVAGLSRLMAISEHGLAYASRKYPAQQDRFLLSRLGTYGYGVGPWSPCREGLRIVSCSRLVALKRVELIISALGLCRIPLCWVHIGSGAGESRMKSLAARLPANVRCIFKGQLSQRDLYRFYRYNEVDLFVNVSESEGVPVSIMEALSFGIPVMATAVGGTPEVVSNENGVLLPADIRADQLAQELEHYFALDVATVRRKRKAAQRTWSKNMQAELCYERFVSLLKKLS